MTLSQILVASLLLVVVGMALNNRHSATYAKEVKKNSPDFYYKRYGTFGPLKAPGWGKRTSILSRLFFILLAAIGLDTLFRFVL